MSKNYFSREMKEIQDAGQQFRELTLSVDNGKLMEVYRGKTGNIPE